MYPTRTKARKPPLKPSSTSTRPSNTQNTRKTKLSKASSDKPTESNLDYDKPEDSPDSQSTKPFDESDPFSTQPSEHPGSSSDKPDADDTNDGPSAANSNDGPSSADDRRETNFLLKDPRHQTINIKSHSDVHTPQVTGCCFMPSGDLVICDYKNQLVKSFSKVFSNTGNISLPVGPFGMAALDQHNCIVTMPGQKQLQLIQVLPSLQLASTIDVKKECWGVAVAGDKIFVTCYTPGNEDGEIRQYGMIGSLVTSLRIYQIGMHTIRRLDNLAISRSGDKIFIPDWETDTLSCIKPDGTLLYQYHNPELESPRGLFVDDGNYVIICGHEGRCVQVITADGRQHKTLLSKTFYDPCSLAFRLTDGTLVIGCSRSEEMYYYKLDFS